MRRRTLLLLYPRAWRQRYQEEISALLDDAPFTLVVAFDLLRGALDAHLHPELVAPLLVASTGSGTIPLGPRSPRAWSLVLVASVLVGLTAFGLAQPLPFVPLIVPIGAHASPEDFARSQLPAALSRCIKVERDGLAGVLCASEDGAETSLVTAYRASTLGWMGGGGSRSAGDAPSAGLPVRVGYSSGWSAGPVGTTRAFGYVTVEGVVSGEVGRVVILFDDGAREDAQLRDNVYLWFDARWDVPAPKARGADPRGQWEREWLGRAASAVIAYATDGRELARRDLRPSTPP